MHDVLASLVRIAALVWKELVTMFRDPGSRKILIVPVLAQAVLFGYGATFNLEHVPWTYCDESRSALSHEVIRKVGENGVFELVSPSLNLDALGDAVERGDALTALYFPDDFAETGRLLVITDARNTTTANVATGYISVIVERLNAQNGNAAPVQLVERFRFNENNITRWNIMPGLILALSLIQVMLLSGLTVSREREEGSFDMMLMTPASSWEIYLGKGLPAIFVGIMQALIIFSVSCFWFEIPFAGSFATLLLVITLFSAAVVGLGLAISAVCRTIQQSMVAAFLCILPAIILSGLGPHDARAGDARVDADGDDHESPSLLDRRRATHLLRGRHLHGRAPASLARGAHLARCDARRAQTLPREDRVRREKKKKRPDEKAGPKREDGNSAFGWPEGLAPESDVLRIRSSRSTAGS